jgi:hypothetical protein
MTTKFLSKELTGFQNGQRSEREFVLHFINYHEEQGVKITVEDIRDELNGRYKFEMKKIVDEMMESQND